MSEWHNHLNEMKEMEKRPSKFYSDEEKIARGIYCRECLESGNKVEIVSGTAVCPRCYCREYNLMVDIDIFHQRDIQRDIQRDMQETIVLIKKRIEDIEIGKTYLVDDIIERIGDMVIGHAIIENVHFYFLNSKDLNNGKKGKNIILLSLINKGVGAGVEKKRSGKEYIKNFILDKETSDALCRLKIFDNKVYKYVMTDIKEIWGYGYTGKDAIRDINIVFREMNVPYKAGKHNKLIKIWRYV